MLRERALVRGKDLAAARRLAKLILNWGFFRELLIIILSYVFYFLVRASVAERAREALVRAVHIINLEDRFGFFWELQMQGWALSNTMLIQFFNQIYIWGNLPFLGVVALWFYLRHRQRYLLFRNAVLISGAIALVFFITLPTAPPRFLWWAGFKDTVALIAGGYYDVQADAFVNRYAAVPSMHFGWILLLGIALVWTARPLPLRLVGAAMPVLMFLSVVVTGNHFIIDALAGGLVALAGLALALLLRRYGEPLGRQVLAKILPRLPSAAS